MKILLVNNIGADYAGAETMVRQLKEGLQARGHEARVLAGDELTLSGGNGFADYTFRSFRDGSSGKILFLFNPFAILALRRALKDFRPDIVHLHNISKASPFILLLLKKIPTLLTIHDHLVFDPTRLHDTPTLAPYEEILSDYFIDRISVRYLAEKLRFFFLKRFYKNIDAVIACSNFYAAAAKESKLFKNVTVIHNGIRPLAFSPIKNTESLLFVGRIDDVKGADILLRAMPEIIRAIPHATLRVAGDGTKKAFCENVAKELNIEKNVGFLGRVIHDASITLMKESAVLVVPSLYPDNFPTVCIEAMFIGRAVVASDIGGIPEIVANGKTGILVPPASSKDIAAAVIALLKNPEQCRVMGEAGHDRALSAFTSDIYLEKTVGLYTILAP